MRIPELAESAGVPASTVRYYERVGLMALPGRTSSGYRDYGEDAAARLLFTRARRMGLSCEQITSLLPVWAGTNCGAAQDRVVRLIEEKQAEIAERVAEPPPQACRSDLSCCVPESGGVPVSLEFSLARPAPPVPSGTPRRAG